MTIGLFQAIGDRLVAVFDNHRERVWEKVRLTLNLNKKAFYVFNKSYGCLSTTSVVGKFCNVSELWRSAGDWLENKTTVSNKARQLAISVNTATKARVKDNDFRVTAVLHLLGDLNASRIFEQRIVEGNFIQRTTEKVLKAAELMGNVVVVSKPAGAKINERQAMLIAYRSAPFVVITGLEHESGEDFCVVGRKGTCSIVGGVSLIRVFEDAGVEPKGSPDKVRIMNVSLDAIVERLNGLNVS